MAIAPSHDTGSQTHSHLPPKLGLIGTLALCAAALMAHLSPEQLKVVAVVLWVLGFVAQAAAFMLAVIARRAD